MPETGVASIARFGVLVMRGVGCRRLLATGLTVLGLASAPPPGGATGPFDAIASIFGEPQPRYGRDRPVVQHYFRYEDLDPVEPPREKRPSFEDDRSDRPVNTAIDPIKVPDWHLTDSTLRRGDIVVLIRGVFVFEGGRTPYAAEDFTPLERSRLSAAERAKIAAMTGYRLDRVGATGRPHPVAALSRELGQATTVSP